MAMEIVRELEMEAVTVREWGKRGLRYNSDKLKKAL